MSNKQNDNFYILAGKPIDGKFGPYISIEEALISIPRSYRYNGLFFGVYDDINNILTTEVTNYYFYGDFSDSEYKRIGKTPVDNIYNDYNELFSKQNEQLSNFLYYVISETSYYEYLGTNNQNITDYRPMGSSGTGTPYTHPLYTPISETLTGALVIDSFTSDNIGSVTSFTTRTLLTSDINAENLDNKATDFSVLNNILYPTTQAVDTYIQSLINGIPTITASTGLEKIGNDIRLGVDTGSARTINFTDFGTSGWINFVGERTNSSGTRTYSQFGFINSKSEVLNPQNSFFINVQSNYPSYTESSGAGITAQTTPISSYSDYSVRTSESTSNVRMGSSTSGGVDSSYLDIYVNNYQTTDKYQRLRLRTNANAVFEDGFYNKGIEYFGDYEANFTARSLITKQYLSNIYSGILAGRGLSSSNGKLHLGNSDYEIQLENFLVSGFYFLGLTHTTTIGGASNYSAISHAVYTNESELYVEAYRGNYSGSQLKIKSSVTEAYGSLGILSHVDSADANIVFNSVATDKIVITDNISNKGAVYDGDYESNFTARSLITKQYADGLFSGGGYIHPTYTVRNITTTGAQVISTFTSDNIGSVTGITTRTLTLNDLGYTGATNADYYHSWNLRTNGIQRITIQSGSILDIVGGSNVTVGYSAGGVVTINSSDTIYTHPTKAWVDKPDLSGPTVISNVTLDSSGHLTDWVTRNITPNDIGAENINNKATDFTVIDDNTYPTTQAVDTLVSQVVEDKHKVLYIDTPQSIWNLPHNLGVRPSPQTYDSSHRRIHGYEEHIDDNNFRVTFSMLISGYVIFN